MSRGNDGSTDRFSTRMFRYGVAMEPKEIIEAAGKTLAELADDPVKILLFGSRARGDAGPESDYDFLVVERDLKDRKAEMIKLRRALRPQACRVTYWWLASATQRNGVVR